VAQDFTAIVPQIWAQFALMLRENALMSRLVNTAYSKEAGENGSTVKVPVGSDMTVGDVTPGATSPAVTTELKPTTVDVAITSWKEVSWAITDLEGRQIRAGVTPEALKRAARALTNIVDTAIFANYKKVAGYFGTAGTTPFSQADLADTSDVTGVRAVLNKQLCPIEDDLRHLVLDPDADGKALTRRALQDASWSGKMDAIIDGRLNRRLGFNFWMDQNVPKHTSTPLSAGAATVNGAHATLGVTTISIAKATGTSPLVKGDIILFTGDPQTYVVTADVTLAVGNTNVTVFPGLKVTKAGGETMTLKATHVVNLAFHRDAFAFVSRPLAPPMLEDSKRNFYSEVDPVSGLSFTVEIKREHYRDRCAVSLNFGTDTIYPEMASRLAG
jgi:hypothetical protein